MTASNTSSSPVAEERLLRVGLGQLYAHPSNSNLMADERLDKLGRNIEREGRYPPLIVRPHPHDAAAFEVLDGHQRLSVLRRLGRDQALCYLWPCDDAPRPLGHSQPPRRRGRSGTTLSASGRARLPLAKGRLSTPSAGERRGDRRDAGARGL